MGWWNVDTNTGYSLGNDWGGYNERMVWASGQVELGRDELSEPKFFDIPVRFILISGYYSGWDVKSTLTSPVGMTPAMVPDFLKLLNNEFGGRERFKVRFFLSQHRPDGGITSIAPTYDNRFLWYYKTGAFVTSGTFYNQFPFRYHKMFLNLYGDPRCLNIIINSMYKGQTAAAFATGYDWTGVVLPGHVTWRAADPLNGNYAIVYNSGLLTGGACFHEIAHEAGIDDTYISQWMFSGTSYDRAKYAADDYTNPVYTGIFTKIHAWMLEHSLNNATRQTTLRNGFGVKQSTECNALYSASGQINATYTPYASITWNRVVFNKLGYIVFPNTYQIYSKAYALDDWILRATIDAETSLGVFPSGYTYNSSTTNSLWKVQPVITDEEWSWKASGVDAHWWNYINYAFDYKYSYYHSTSGIYTFDYR